jgi:hypothetical protein
MKSFFLLLLISVCLQTGAQLPDYYVYLVTGEVTITKPGAKPVPVKQKDLVYKNDILTLKKGMSVTLVDRDASFLTLNSPIKCSGSELNQKAGKKGNDGVTGKYLQLLYHELLDPSHDFEKFKKQNIAGIRGGVSRGDECNNRIFPINGLKTSAASIVFKWHATSPASGYSFEIYDGENKLVDSIHVKDTVYTIVVSEALKGKRGTFKWRVISADGNCEDEIPIYFEILTPESEQKLVEQLTAATDNPSLEKQLQQVDKLEKNGLIDAASSRYAAIVKTDPGDKALLKSYIVFLLKYGFDDKAKAAWKP